MQRAGAGLFVLTFHISALDQLREYSIIPATVRVNPRRTDLARLLAVPQPFHRVFVLLDGDSRCFDGHPSCGVPAGRRDRAGHGGGSGGDQRAVCDFHQFLCERESYPRAPSAADESASNCETVRGRRDRAEHGSIRVAAERGAQQICQLRASVREVSKPCRLVAEFRPFGDDLSESEQG